MVIGRVAAVRVVAAAAVLTLGGGVAVAATGAAGGPRHAPVAAGTTRRATTGPPVAEVAPSRSPAGEPVRWLADAGVAHLAPRPLRPAAQGSGLHRPDLLVVARHSLGSAVARLRRLPGVAALTTVDVGRVGIDGAKAVVYGVDPASFRAFTPAPSAASDPLWESVARGELAASFDMAHELRLPLGGTVTVSAGRAAVPLRVGAFASTGLPQTDAVVARSRSADLGLTPSAGVVVTTARGADPKRLQDAVRRVVGAGVEVQLLHRVVAVRDPGALLAVSTISTAVHAAASRLGDPYRWGATGPAAFDCSGLVQWAFARAGVALPRTAAEQWYAGPHVAYADARPGDLLFWAYDPTAPGFIDHVALYVGHGMMIVAPHTGDVVSLRPVPMTHFVGVVRVAPHLHPSFP